MLLFDYSVGVLLEKTSCSPASTFSTQALQSSCFLEKITDGSSEVPSTQIHARSIINSQEPS
jgi:hypothetical protein